MNSDDYILGPPTDHELWMHKEKPIMIEYYFKRVNDFSRTLKPSIQMENGALFIGQDHKFHAANMILDIGFTDRVIFPGDFEKIGDI